MGRLRGQLSNLFDYELERELESAIELGRAPSSSSLPTLTGFVASFGAATQWVVNHNLGRPVLSVTLETVGGVEFDAEVHNVSDNQTVISFDAPIAGVVKIF